MTLRQAQNTIITILLVAVLVLPVACDVVQATTATPTATPTPAARATPTMVAPASSTPVGTKNTLVIDQPTPDTVVVDKVMVKGEGMAYENSITVEVVANGATLGRSKATTDGQPGQVGKFSADVTVGPLGADTDGLVTIYTTSARDGSIDQRASVPVKLKAHGQTPSPGAYTTHPNIVISPTRGRSGMEITVVGSGFRPNGTVQIRLGTVGAGTQPQVYATTQVGEHGTIQASFIMPFHWPTGEDITARQLVIVASSPDFIDKATAQFTFDAPTPLPQTTTTPTP